MTAFTLHPRLEADSIFIRDLPLSQLRLQNQAAMPWLVLVPRRAAMTEICDLSMQDQQSLMQEISQTSKALRTLFNPTKINIGALGNIVPQLHIHVMARFNTDPAWPNPVWGNIQAHPYEQAAAAKLIDQLKNQKL